MQLSFHPGVAADITRIVTHYEDLGGPHLAEEFYVELRAAFLKAQAAPRSYRNFGRGLRRVNQYGSFPLPLSVSDRRQ